MYVVKVGEYYVKGSVMNYNTNSSIRVAVCSNEIVLSKEMMTGFSKNIAETIAKKVNGEVIEIAEEVTND